MVYELQPNCWKWNKVWRKRMASSISSTNEPYSQSSTTRPLFEIPDDTKDLDSGNESQNEEGECLIKPEKKPSTTNPFRRVSTHCMHPTVPCPTCKGKGKLSQGKTTLIVKCQLILPCTPTLWLLTSFEWTEIHHWWGYDLIITPDLVIHINFEIIFNYLEVK